MILNISSEHFDINELIKIYTLIQNSEVLLENAKASEKLYKDYLNTIKS